MGARSPRDPQGLGLARGLAEASLGFSPFRCANFWHRRGWFASSTTALDGENGVVRYTALQGSESWTLPTLPALSLPCAHAYAHAVVHAASCLGDKNYFMGVWL